MDNHYKLSLAKYSTHNIILKNVGNNKVVLDIGCNDGYVGKIADNTNKFYGIDYLKESIEEAKKIYVDALQYDLNDLKFLPWNIKFDVIIFADVLEHVLYPKEVLTFFVKNYLKDNGKIIISLPNIANWQVRINLLWGKFDYTDTGIMDKTHLHFYTFKTAKQLIEIADLRVIEKSNGASFFGPVIKIFPFLKYILATNIILICKKV